MKTIWKYELETVDEQEIKMPLGTEILTVQIQYGKPHIWCGIFAMNAPLESRIIRILGTGQPIENNYPGIYIGTYQSITGKGIFHVFDYGYKFENNQTE